MLGLSLAVALAVGQFASASPEAQTSPVKMVAPLHTAGLWPACTTGDGCVLDCAVGLNTGADAWECRDGNGVPVVVTQGTGTTYEASPLFRGARIATTAQAPIIDGGNVPGAFRSLFTADHTCTSTIRVGDPSSIRYWFSYSGGVGVSGAYGLFASGNSGLNVVWNGGGSNVATGGGTGGPFQINQVATRRSGTTYTVRGNGSQQSLTNTLAIVAPSESVPLRFGTSPSISQVLDGTLYTFRCWNRALSDDELARLESLTWGTVAGTRNVTTTRASQAWMMGAPEPENLVTWSEDFSQWSGVAASELAENVAIAPDGTLTAAKITDDSAVASEGVVAPSSTFPPGTYTGTIWARSDTPGTAFRVLAFGATCNHWITTEWAQYSCTNTISSTTSVYPVAAVMGPSSAQGSAYIWRPHAFEGSGSAPTYVRTYANPKPRGPFVYSYGNNAGRVHPDYGLLSFEARTNLWTNSLDVSGGPAGAMSLSMNADSGPFSRYNGGPEAEILTDTTSSSGYSIRTVSYTGIDKWTVSSFVKAGTMTGLRVGADIGIGSVGDGGGYGVFQNLHQPSTATCSVTSTYGTGACSILCSDGKPCSSGTGIPFVGGYVRVVLTHDVDSSTSTQVRGIIYQGVGAGDTGTTYISQSQLERAASAGPPIVCGASACSTVADAHRVSTAGWPTATGTVSIYYRPSVLTGNNQMLVDTRTGTGASDSGFVVWVVSGSNNPGFEVRNGANIELVTIPNAFVVGSEYRLDAQWRDGCFWLEMLNLSNGLRHSSVTKCAPSAMPTRHAAEATVGTRFNSSSPANGYIKLLRVSQ